LTSKEAFELIPIKKKIPVNRLPAGLAPYAICNAVTVLPGVVNTGVGVLTIVLVVGTPPAVVAEVMYAHDAGTEAAPPVMTPSPAAGRYKCTVSTNLNGI
jgi:hypothetical protein